MRSLIASMCSCFFSSAVRLDAPASLFSTPGAMRLDPGGILVVFECFNRDRFVIRDGLLVLRSYSCCAAALLLLLLVVAVAGRQA